MASSEAKARYDAKRPTLGGRVSLATYTFAVKQAAARGITKGQFVELAVTHWESLEKAFAVAVTKREAKHAAEVNSLRQEIEVLSSAVLIERPCQCGRSIRLDLRREGDRAQLRAVLPMRPVCFGGTSHGEP